MRPRLDLHIEELVLEGFSPGDRYRIGEALQMELTRLLEERWVPGSFASEKEVDRINGGSFEAASGSKAEKIGAQVARAVYVGLKR